ncbi:hypothetical protein KQI41_02490 [Tissierella pigra]|uniref:hypothetical protein n=1 Tax=Tissierella pigra TaxID=2607614 RepID=UPI001C10A4A1|nr:hypothetical protein [Tissierella pigra]MBU5425269.1 hypothetical protein [Tissierella pigra]
MKKRKLICAVTLMVLLLNLSMVVFAGDDAGTTRPNSIPLPIESQEPIIGFFGDDAGTTRPD